MFSLITFSLPALCVLPVEMLAEIFRYLDDKSLLNTALASKYFMKICKGDPTLRRRIRRRIIEEKRIWRDVVMNAKMDVSIIRDESSKVFGRNLKKTVTIRPISIRNHQKIDTPKAKTFDLGSLDARRKGGGKLKVNNSSKVRVKPYNSLRC
ncbi:hypothetical protein RI129_010004 [Pyrocoelia pectoralis]|uniref:F-box domain-containing protein n=1 Tax=Pyrocoelia pectoralis TaxID=417401 RepID=A0AAN7V5U6_9COLE